jgi:hypothetical protein
LIKHRLIANVRAAQVSGLTLPVLLLHADEVIQRRFLPHCTSPVLPRLCENHSLGPSQTFDLPPVMSTFGGEADTAVTPIDAAF